MGTSRTWAPRARRNGRALAPSDQTDRRLLGNGNGPGNSSAGRPLGERGVHHLSLRQPVQIRARVGQPGDRALSVQSRRPGGIDRSVPVQATRALASSSCSFQLSVKTDLRPVWYFGQPRHQGRSGHRRLATRRTVSLSPGTPATRGSPSGEPAGPRMPNRSRTHQPIHTNGMGVTAASRYRLSIDPHGTSTLTFVIAGSATDQERGGQRPTSIWPRTRRACSRKKQRALGLAH